MNSELRAEYIDEGGNIQFGDMLLEERWEEPKANNSNDLSKDDLKQTLRSDPQTTTEQKRTIKSSSERFMLEKFTDKNSNVTQWIDIFERECERLDVQRDEEKIEILRLFLEGSCVDWYSSMLMKHSINSSWADWKEDFVETYSDKGWSTARYAINFKYIGGSLLDYALKKEKILLEVDKNMNAEMMILLIAISLPEYISDRIDRNEIKGTRDLLKRIKSLEYLVEKGDFSEEKNPPPTYKNKVGKKNPCKVCELMGKKNRHHPESVCWFRTKTDKEEEKNPIKLVNNSHWKLKSHKN